MNTKQIWERPDDNPAPSFAPGDWFEQEDDDDEEGCQVMVDLGEYCNKPITTIVAEPYTPAAFQIECCDDCAKSHIDFGYKLVRRLQ
jgi:hypothetical protein